MSSPSDRINTVNRIGYFDTLRFIAMFIIYVTHFINKFNDQYFKLWNTLPSSVFLSGLTGKFGVVLFGVILGYFAYLSNDSNSTRYVIKRYMFFAFGGFVINTIYFVVGLFLEGFKSFTIINVFVESLLLGDGIFATYWCIPYFFLASIISYLNNKIKTSTIFILFEIFILFLLGQLWVSVCLFGNIVAQCKSRKTLDFILKKRLVRIIFWLLVFFAIKIPNYLFDAVCCSLVILLIEYGSISKKILNNKFTSYLGEQGMGVYLLHPICYNLLGPILFDAFSFLPYPAAFLIVIVLCFIVIVLISIPTVYLINSVTKLVGSIVTFLQRLCKDKLFSKFSS